MSEEKAFGSGGDRRFYLGACTKSLRYGQRTVLGLSMREAKAFGSGEDAASTLRTAALNVAAFGTTPASVALAGHGG